MSERDSWRWVGASVRGTSHVGGGLPCQDASAIRQFEHAAHGAVLVLACADGAGSASMSQVGSLLAVRSVVRTVANFVADGHGVRDIDDGILRRWFEVAAADLQEEADEAERPIGDYACTLLCAIVDQHAAAYAQLGDGAIVAGCGDDVAPVFWPQQGEFANSTFFITSPRHLELVQTRTHGEVPERIALMSDGLQNLALRMSDRTAHAGFFSPLFDGLLAQPVGLAEGLELPLAEFLDSPRINARSDDDKSLLLAVRELPEMVEEEADVRATRESTRRPPITDAESEEVD